jgi:hypothetical protein
MYSIALSASYRFQSMTQLLTHSTHAHRSGQYRVRLLGFELNRLSSRISTGAIISMVSKFVSALNKEGREGGREGKGADDSESSYTAWISVCLIMLWIIWTQYRPFVER